VNTVQSYLAGDENKAHFNRSATAKHCLWPDTFPSIHSVFFGSLQVSADSCLGNADSLLQS